MKRVYLRHVHAVGMHHHGKREPALDLTNTLQHEPENVFDQNASCIKDKDCITQAYLKRVHALVVANIVKSNVPNGTVYLRPKEKATVVTQR